MKISEIRPVVKEDLKDAIKSGLYRATGGGLYGRTGQQAALKGNFITKFANQLALNLKSSKSAGVGGFDLDDYLKTYAAQYGWNLTPVEIENITKLSTKAGPNPGAGSLQKIANYMYILADKYRDTRKTGGAPEASGGSTPKRGGGSPTGPTAPAAPTGPTAPTAPAVGSLTAPTGQTTAGTAPSGSTGTTGSATKSGKASVTADNIMSALGQLFKTPNSASDLDKILRDVAYLLSRKDAGRYAHVIKDLTSGIGGTSAAGTKGTPFPGDQTKQQTKSTRTQSTATPPKDAEQAMPGYNKAADELSSKMKSNLPRDPTISKPYRPGSRPPEEITDVEPKKLKESKKIKRK